MAATAEAAVKTSPGQDPVPPSLFFRIRSSPSYTLATLCLAFFNDSFLFGAIIPVLPYALHERIEIDEDDAQIWISVLLAIYGGAVLIGSLVFGWLGDTFFKRRTLYIGGLLALTGATVFLALGRHIVILALGRLIQGLGAAIVWTSGLPILIDTFGQDRFGEFLGYVLTSVSVGSTCAPLLGGLVYSRAGYGGVSLMTVGVVVLELILALIMVDSNAASETGGPTPSSPRLSAGNKDQTADDEGVGQARKQNQRNTTVEPPSTLPDERQPLISKKANEGTASAHKTAYILLLRSHRILAALWGIFTYACVLISFEGMLPLFAKETFHWNSTSAALIYLGWIIPGFLGPIAGKASDRFGPRWIAVGGFLCGVPPLILLRLVTNDSISQKVLLCSLLALVGIALVFTIPALLSDITIATADLQRDDPVRFGDSPALAQSFGLFLSSFSGGTLVGPMVAGVLKVRAGWGAATLILALACAFASIPIMLKTPAAPSKRQTMSVVGS